MSPYCQKCHAELADDAKFCHKCGEKVPIEPVKEDYTREELIEIAERSFVPQDQWRDRDSATAQLNVGEALTLLKSGCNFVIEPQTDRNTIWIEFTYKGFNYFEFGEEDSMSDETSYLPTPKRLEEAAGEDWY